MTNLRTRLCIAALCMIAACTDSNGANDAGPSGDTNTKDGGAGHGGSGGQNSSGSGGHGTAGGSGGNSSADAGAKTCQELGNQSSAAVQSAIASAGLSCSAKSDCEEISVDTDCFASCGALVGPAAKKAAAAAIAAQNAGVCKDFAKAGCNVVIPPCAPPIPGGFDCIAGECRSKGDMQATDAGSLGDGGSAATNCVERAIAWGPNGGLVARQDHYELQPCNGFAMTRTPVTQPGTATTCSNKVADDAGTSVADVNAALDNADVKAAIVAAPVLFGADSRPVDGTVFRIEVGSAVIELGDDCNGASGCKPIPAGLGQLQTVLTALTDQQMMFPNCDSVQ